jgi:hypothetical protein
MIYFSIHNFALIHLFFPAGLSDYQVRDLNDEINKLMREKLAWEHRIKELGGPDYLVSINTRSVDIWNRRLTHDFRK